MPLFIGDYLASTQHLSAEQSGGYLHLLMHEWKTGPLPLDLEVLRRISRIERDAWSNAWALLEHFFTHTEAGFVQVRLELEKARSQDKQQATTLRAKAAADKRWANAGSDAQAMPKHIPSIAPLVLEECPSPSPSPSDKKHKQKNSLAMSESEPRFRRCKDVIASYWSRHTSLAMEWGKQEQGQLGRFLRSNPGLTSEGFARLVGNRENSLNVNHGVRPMVWIPKLTEYAHGPLNEFNKPMGGESGRSKGKTASSVSAARAAIEAIENRSAADAACIASANELGDGGLSDLREGSGILRADGHRSGIERRGAA
jgi:uncharacterized protein YdaU (DUF1376 family)